MLWAQALVWARRRRWRRGRRTRSRKWYGTRPRARRCPATTASSAGEALVRSLGADTVIDYRTQDFTDQLRDQDFVLANQDAKTLVRSLNVMAPGGTLVSLSGPPDPAFARAQGMNPVMRFIMGLLSLGVRREARARGVDYRFLFMRADGAQLARITTLVEAGTIKPVIDRRFGFDAVNDAMAYLDSGHAKGKVVIDVATTR